MAQSNDKLTDEQYKNLIIFLEARQGKKNPLWLGDKDNATLLEIIKEDYLGPSYKSLEIRPYTRDDLKSLFYGLTFISDSHLRIISLSRELSDYIFGLLTRKLYPAEDTPCKP